VSDQPVPSVGALCVDTIQLAQNFGQVRLRRLDDGVLMVRHLAVGMAAPVEPLTHVAEEVEPSSAVYIVTIDGLTPIAARGDVVEPAG
jgi:hypothetical protein